jgi:hypothetical protein
VFFALVKDQKIYNLVQQNVQEKNAQNIEIIINTTIMNRMVFIACAVI